MAMDVELKAKLVGGAEVGKTVMLTKTVAVGFFKVAAAKAMGFTFKGDPIPDDEYTYIWGTERKNSLANNGIAAFKTLEVAKQHFLNFSWDV